MEVNLDIDSQELRKKVQESINNHWEEPVSELVVNYIHELEQEYDKLKAYTIQLSNRIVELIDNGETTVDEKMASSMRQYMQWMVTEDHKRLSSYMKDKGNIDGKTVVFRRYRESQ